MKDGIDARTVDLENGSVGARASILSSAVDVACRIQSQARNRIHAIGGFRPKAVQDAKVACGIELKGFALAEIAA